MKRITLPRLTYVANVLGRDMRDLHAAIRKLDSVDVYSTIIVDKGSRTYGNSWAARIEVWRQGGEHPLYGIRIHAPTARELMTRMEWYRDGVMCGLRGVWSAEAGH